MAIPPPPAESSMLEGAIPPPPEDSSALGSNEPAPQLAGMLADSGVNPQLPDFIRNINPARALLTNEPTQGIGETVLRGVPATVGSMLGGAAGLGASVVAAPFTYGASLATGPADAIYGAGIGGMAGESARQGVAQIYAGLRGTQFTPPGTAIKDIAVQGLAGAAGEGFGQTLSALRKPAINMGSALMRNAAGIPEDSARAALGKLGLIGNAPGRDAEKAAYDAFHSASGTMSRKEFIARQVDPVDTAERAMADMKEIWAKGASGQQLTNQELVNGSQAARVIRDAKASGNEFARGVSDAADQMKGVFDQHIELRHPEWQAARQTAWENGVADDFTSAFPLNKNGSSNQLRGALAIGGIVGSLGEAARAFVGGSPGTAAVDLAVASAIPVIQAPLAYGAAIKTAAALSPLAKAVAMGIRFVPGSIAAMYNAPQAQ